MWAKIRGIAGFPDTLEVTLQVDAEQLASITAHLAENRYEKDREFQIIPKVTAEAVDDETPCGHTFVIQNAPNLHCVALRGHAGGHVIESGEA